MVINSLPNPAISFSTERPKLHNNLVLHATSREKYQYPPHATPYMLLANLDSVGMYVVNNQKLILTGKSFLFLNANDQLSISYQNDPVNCFFVLFEDNFVRQSFHAFTTDRETLLAQPFDSAAERNITRSIPLKIDAEIFSLFNLIIQSGSDRNVLDEKLLFLLGKVNRLRGDRAGDIDKIPATKKSTRIELYRRLFIAREFMESAYSKSRLNVDEIAHFASLDKFHFILNFKQVFGYTPHQYLIEIRLKKAYDLVMFDNYSITEVCYLTGFESLPSFSNLFKKRFGILPSILAKTKGGTIKKP